MEQRQHRLEVATRGRAGTWQGIYLYEHRIWPRWRELVLHLMGDPRRHGGGD